MQTLTVSEKSVEPYAQCEVLATRPNVVRHKLVGLGASPGIVEGPCTIIRNHQGLSEVQNGTILVCEIPSPSLAPYMALLGGLVAEQGGPLAIASGYAREYEIPAVVGLKGAMGAIRNGDVIRVDGLRGTVEIISVR